MKSISYTLKIFWVFILLSLLMGLVILFKKEALSFPDIYFFSFFVAAGLCSWMYITFRVAGFYGKFLQFIKKIMENEYKAGIKASPLFDDELSVAEDRINKLADQLRQYNELQVDRISALSRAIDNIYRNVQEGIIVYSIEKKAFQVNPAVQSIYEVNHENFSYDSLAKQELNKNFILLLKKAVEEGRVIRDEKIQLELPIRQARRELFVTIIPIKDKNEIVELAIIFVKLLD